MTEEVRTMTIKEVKTLRVAISKIEQELICSSRETSLSKTKLQEAKMWLGMELSRLGALNPYPESYNPENDKVEPTADVYNPEPVETNNSEF